MSLVISTILNTSSNKFEEVEQVTREILAEHGFGILTEIDVKETLKNKIGVEMKPYKILGACNPPYDHKAISLVPEIGALLPCNVIVYENENNKIVVSAMDPITAMSVVRVDGLSDVAGEVNKIMKEVIKKIEEKFS